MAREVVVTEPTQELDALRRQAHTKVVVLLLAGDSAELIERERNAVLVLEPPVERERLAAVPLACLGVRLADDEGDRTVERVGARGGRRLVPCEQLLEARPPFGEVAAHRPEACERRRERQRLLALPGRVEVVECGAEVVMLRIEPVEPRLRPSSQLDVC